MLPSIDRTRSTIVRMRSFLLAFYGNTGSSWLIQMLGSPPDVFIPGFEPLERWSAVGDRSSGWDVTDAERLGWMRTVFAPPEDRGGPAYEAWLEEAGKNPHFSPSMNPSFSVVGFKMNSQSVSDRTALFEALLELGTQVIVLQRSNRIKHALSLYRYHEEDKSQFDEGGIRPPSEIDLEVFHGWLKESVTLHRQSEVFWAQGRSVLNPDAITRVRYEEFIDDDGKAETMERLTEFLQLDGLSYEVPLFSKATPDSLESAVVNYEELVAHYRGSEFQQFLTE